MLMCKSAPEWDQGLRGSGASGLSAVLPGRGGRGPALAEPDSDRVDPCSSTTYLSATPKAALVLAHGAGAGQTSPFMVRFARGMALRDINAATFDFPYTAAGRKVPDRAPVLEESWREALAAAKNGVRGRCR